MINTRPFIPWKPEDVAITGRGGKVINKDQVEYFKDLVSALYKIHASIGNSINLMSYRKNGTATVASGTTSIAVDHGVSKTPGLKDISVTPTNDLGSASKFWITTPTATQFTINVDVNPGAGGATFVWEVHIE